jgi:glycosyltransferase involved in cell wall biosynthesis
MACYCEPDDLSSIRHAVEDALKSPASPELRKRVLAEYNWQRAGEATLAAYQRALA